MPMVNETFLLPVALAAWSPVASAFKLSVHASSETSVNMDGPHDARELTLPFEMTAIGQNPWKIL